MKSSTHIKGLSSVMPAWIAGIQVRRMRLETSMSVWIPALHAGMTQSDVLPARTAFLPRIFQRERTKGSDISNLHLGDLRDLGVEV